MVKEILIKTQTDDQIPIHILHNVSAQSQSMESDLARSRGPRPRLLADTRRRKIPKTPSKSTSKANNSNTPGRTPSTKMAAARQMFDSALTVTGRSKFKHKEDAEANVEEDWNHLRNKKIKDREDSVLEDEEEERDKENRHDTVAGRDLYGFVGRKKNRLEEMLKDLVESAKTEEGVSPVTTPSRRHKINDKLTYTDPDRVAKRRRITQQVNKLNRIESEEEDEGDEEENEVDDEASDGEEDLVRREELDERIFDSDNEKSSEDEGSTGIRLGGGKIPIAFEDSAGYESYFRDLHGRSLTSNRTLSKLPTLEQHEFLDLIAKAPRKHAEELTILRNLHKMQFQQWYFELSCGFNLLFYGYGSKRKLLLEFAKQYCTDGVMLVVNGYFPTVSARDILRKIIEGVVRKEEYGTSMGGSLQEQVRMLREFLADPEREFRYLYLIVHNIDGAALRSEKSQLMLSQLAAIPGVRVIASVDHINAGLLWDSVKRARFNWIWHDATTYEDYLAETSYEGSLLMVRGEELGVRGARHVLMSLTTNARGVFRVLAEHQIASAKEAGNGRENKLPQNQAVAQDQLFQWCRERFLVSTQLTFETQLTEFRDHKLIMFKTVDGVRMLWIPLTVPILESILEGID
ncbi:uncharacterized protein VTP21DRAFT_3465 [Calcarisporiella thermophila]|uniref:uncharacterized protein n=1 Tax=Calcarisporiella thermophila TaxID=911321 RepID=UPI0037429FA3